MRHIQYILLLILSISCKAHLENDQKKAIINDSIFTEKAKESVVDKPPLNINEIKALDFLEATTGVIPTSETTDLCKPNMDGFFGGYNLINKHKNSYIGYLKVFVNTTPVKWRYDNEDEIFTAIEIEGSEIKIWDSISVGLSEYDLKKFLKGNFHYKEGNMIYSDVGGYAAEFWIKDDTVNKIKVRRVCNSDNNENH